MRQHLSGTADGVNPKAPQFVGDLCRQVRAQALAQLVSMLADLVMRRIGKQFGDNAHALTAVTAQHLP